MSGNGFPVVLPKLSPTSLSADTPFDASLYSDVEFQFDAGGPVTVTRSLDGVKPYETWPVLNKLRQSSMSATATGIYSVDGGAFLKFSGPVVVTGRA